MKNVWAEFKAFVEINPNLFWNFIVIAHFSKRLKVVSHQKIKNRFNAGMKL